MSERHRRLPEGRFGRVTRLATLGARTGVSLLSGRGAEQAAERAAEVLGTLRGLAAKVGQMASYVDGFVPEEQRTLYEGALKSLQMAAPTSSATEIRRVIEDELGAPVDRLFAEFDEEPFASASIGQVHRAVLEDGRAVAVKVQHPGIERAIESDLANAGMLTSLIAGMGPRTLEAKRVLEEVKARFREELDYRLEAEQQRRFAEMHAGDEAVMIPAVIAARSGRRVMTSVLVEGADLDAAAAASPAERRAWGKTLWRFVFRGNLVGGRFNADPHPGNYLFQDDGRIWFLDFGCVQVIEPVQQAKALRLHSTAIVGDEPAFGRAVADLLGTRGGSWEEATVAYTRRCFRPLFEAPFHMERDYVAGLVSDIQSMKKLMLDRKSRFVQMPEGMVFMNRLQFGFYSVLARLDVDIDYRSEEREFLDRAGLL
ncbi:MAG: AarF/ABC1/UbiB kinase family protein [Myxococcales bacterium]|nr:AarF/ABC1/UbiB kinase family protein [Myxococcales bacterium]